MGGVAPCGRYLIWNTTTRAELLEFLDVQLHANYASPLASPLAVAESFVSAALAPELRVGAVYVRVYNAQPSYPLHDAPSFCAALLDFLEQAVASPDVKEKASAKSVCEALQALAHLLEASYDLEETLLTPAERLSTLSTNFQGNA